MWCQAWPTAQEEGWPQWSLGRDGVDDHQPTASAGGTDFVFAWRVKDFCGCRGLCWSWRHLGLHAQQQAALSEACLAIAVCQKAVVADTDKATG